MSTVHVWLWLQFKDRDKLFIGKKLILDDERMIM